MGAPTKPRTSRAKAKATKGPTLPAEGAGWTDEDIARLEAEVEAQFEATGPIGPNGEITPVEIGGTPSEANLTHIFTLEGEKYYVPKSPSPAILLRFMREIRDKRVGRDAAIEHAMLDMLGKKKLDLLCESELTTDDNVADVFIIVGHILFTAIKKWRARVDPAMDPS